MNDQIFYNENDPRAAAWLRNLTEQGLIPKGYVDERSIKEIEAGDLSNYAQCHFFAGIGGWAYALKLAGWPNSLPVWTGSCPCQPLSCAGQRAGEMDERHLWPDFCRLIAQCRPATVFGEQVASSDGIEWLDGICLDLEELEYSVGAACLPAASVGSPQSRHRIFWVADAEHDGRFAIKQSGIAATARVLESQVRRNEADRLGNAISNDLGRDGETALGAEAEGGRGRQSHGNRSDLPGPAGATDYWGQFAVATLTDGTSRRFEPGSFPLAHGLSARVGRLRGYGNAIVPQVAAKFIKAYLESS